MLRCREKASCKEHLLSVFNLLTQLSKNEAWIERTGGSLMDAEKIISNFPEAKYIVLEREIEATAQSMSKYPFFRLYYRLKSRQSLSYPEMYAYVDPKEFETSLNKDIENCKELMNKYNCEYEVVKYEDLVLNTCRELKKICSFFELKVNEDKGELEAAVNLFPPKQ